MKTVELRRHAEKSLDGMLTKKGIEASKKLGESLPSFSKVVSSDSERAQLTAKLIANLDPCVDTRAAMWMTAPKSSGEINKIATEQNILFLEAIEIHNDPHTLEGTALRANELNELIDQLFTELSEDEHGLIISHDLTINAAMTKRGLLPEALAPLEGYVISEDGSVRPATLQ